MTKRWMTAAAALLFAVPAYAQDAACAPGAGALDPNTISSDACQKAIDLFKYMAPQLGTSLTGASAILGQGGTLGGLGHFAIDIRGNVLAGSLPQIDESQVSTTGRVVTNYKTKDQILGLPAVNASVGLFKGIPLGLTNVGGIDALVTATYVPEVDADEVQVKVPDGSLKFGYGVRVGLLQESLLLPGVSATWMKKDLPKINMHSNVNIGGNNTDIYVDSLVEKTTAWRITASKSFLLFRLSAGYGQDKYESSADIRSVTNVLGTNYPRNAHLDQNLTRSVLYGGVGLNLVVVKLFAEGGQVSGGTITTYNQFDKKPDDSRLFGSVGLRFGF